jgi:hypothetical protein
MKIAFISQPEYFRFIYEDDLCALGDVREFGFNFLMGEEDLRQLEEFDADINIFFRGEFFPEKVLRRLRGIKVSLSSEPFPSFVNGKLNYTVDSLKRYKTFRQIIEKPFDYVFHYDNSSLPFLQKDGINLSGVFYFPVATDVYKRQELKKKWDFFFIGRSTYRRELFFNPLKHCYHFLHICHGIWGEELVRYANQSTILLNVHAENEVSWEPRLQMLMSTGNLVISEPISPNPYFVPGEDYIEISTPEELFEAGKYYTDHQEERERIAMNGERKVAELFRTKDVFGKFVEDLLANKYERFSVCSGQSHFLMLEVRSRVRKAFELLRLVLTRQKAHIGR